ncbi:glycoside hydrolase family protein [Streptomyces lycii]|uniref:xylan 1,4-beta-xylosidase n=1 Tax=Streptomyces lycii TaxID=2654337 RepID=UPI001F3105F2|nr:xylan 1,4-beta-xylosidase [Streptomyces lycii]
MTPHNGTGGVAVARARRRKTTRSTLRFIGAAAAAASLLLVVAWPPGGGEGVADGRGGAGSGPHGSSRPAADSAGPALGWGLTHTRYSADQGERGARERAEKLLSQRRLPQNQHIMGWGALNPEPSPGRYDFASLDSRVELVRRTGGTPVITLCCAPDWMKGGADGETDWSRERLETAPDPEHYDDFAKLAGVVAERYPDVRHFIVWNELKGFFDDDRNRWDAESYTRLYNKVYAELKRVDENNLVGGPYVVMDSRPPGDDTHASPVRGPWGSVDRRALDALGYWDEHKVGADFVVVDGPSYTHEDELVPDEFTATEKFGAVGRWVRERTGLPLWWAEWYVEPGDADDARDGWSERHRVAVHAAGMMAMARGGAATGLYWNPQRRGADCPGCLWRGTADADGGGALPMMSLLSRFGREFPPGTRFTEAKTGGDGARHLKVLADDRVVLAVNTLGRAVKAEVDGEPVEFGPYGVRWLTR